MLLFLLWSNTRTTNVFEEILGPFISDKQNGLPFSRFRFLANENEKIATKFSELHQYPQKKNLSITQQIKKEVTDGQKLRKIETNCNRGF